MLQLNTVINEFKDMTRTEIIKHYKSFFGLEELKMGENDYLMIDWAHSLLKDKAEVNNGVLDDVIVIHLKALTKKIEDSHCYGFEDVLNEYLDSL